MPKKKFSHLDIGLLILAALVLVLNAALPLDASRIRAEKDKVSIQVRKTAIALKKANSAAQLEKLKEEEGKLKEEVAGVFLTAAESKELTIRFWEWAELTGVELSKVSFSANTVELAGVNCLASSYSIQATGKPWNLTRLIVGFALSSYKPVIEKLSLTRSGPAGTWKATLAATIYARIE